MNPIVKKDILNVLREASDIIKNSDILKLRELSDHIIHNVSVFQDKDSITMAVTIYALSKMYKKANEVDRFVPLRLNNATKYLEEGNEEKYSEEMKAMIQDISNKSQKTRLYIQEVVEQAEIKKGSKMFEHGISMAQVAGALGISLWDIMDYVGKTRIIDEMKYKTDVMGKLKLARQLFGVSK